MVSLPLDKSQISVQNTLLSSRSPFCLPNRRKCCPARSQPLTNHLKPHSNTLLFIIQTHTNQNSLPASNPACASSTTAKTATQRSTPSSTAPTPPAFTLAGPTSVTAQVESPPACIPNSKKTISCATAASARERGRSMLQESTNVGKPVDTALAPHTALIPLILLGAGRRTIMGTITTSRIRTTTRI